MRILITAGLSGQEVGGPAQYGENLQKVFQEVGHSVKLVSYGKTEKFLPIGLRHLYFFLKILPRCLWANYVVTLDTFSVGLPSVVATRIFGKKVIVRVGGDFLWSAYVNRTGVPITLPEFYKNFPELNRKEWIILSLTKFLTKSADFLAFNTEWQKGIWEAHYDIKSAGVVRNFVSEKRDPQIPKIKNFLWAGRSIPEKNLEMLKNAGRRVGEKYRDFRLDIVTRESHEQVLERVKGAYALVSTAFSDICPNFILEGTYFNKPFVMTKETGLNELFPEGGIFFDPLKQEELESAIEAMLDYRVYNKLVEELKDNKIKNSWKEMAEEYLDIWKRN